MANSRVPPALYTFPGSGNTWTRLLIEYSTGYLTGSVNADYNFAATLPGEFTCNKSLSILKIHTTDSNYESLINGTYYSNENKCQKNSIDIIKQYILVIRNPFDAIWAEFQRHITKKHSLNIHIYKEDTDLIDKFYIGAIYLSHQIKDMWQQYQEIEKLSLKNDYIYIKYENLLNNTIRINELIKIYNFLNISNYINDNNNEDMNINERLECAFELSDKRSTHRNKNITTNRLLTLNNNNNTNSNHINNENSDSNILTKYDVYSNITLVCQMWAIFGYKSSLYGYKPFGNIKCTNYF